MTSGVRHGESWTVGADAVRSGMRSETLRQVPVGRLHAVGGAGLLAGRSVCLAPVALLDPVEWSWPDDPDDAEGPLCWICLALTA